MNIDIDINKLSGKSLTTSEPPEELTKEQLEKVLAMIQDSEVLVEHRELKLNITYQYSIKSNMTPLSMAFCGV